MPNAAIRGMRPLGTPVCHNRDKIRWLGFTHAGADEDGALHLPLRLHRPPRADRLSEYSGDVACTRSGCASRDARTPGRPCSAPSRLPSAPLLHHHHIGCKFAKGSVKSSLLLALGLPALPHGSLLLTPPFDMGANANPRSSLEAAGRQAQLESVLALALLRVQPRRLVRVRARV